MSFLAILIALLLEQVRPVGQDNAAHGGLRAWCRWARRNADTGQSHHGLLAWLLAVFVPVLLITAVHFLLASVATALAFAWTVVVLYFAVGFRQFSHHFTEIRDALESGDENAARVGLARWQRVDLHTLARDELLRHVIEHSVLAAHRHVFGVLAWFMVFWWAGLGPAGAVLYRLAEYLSRSWRERPTEAPSAPLREWADRAWRVIDHVPARLTSMGFAVVGNFEDAIANWRQDATRFAQPNDGVLLATAAGAMNVRLGGRSLSESAQASSPNAVALTDGREPQLAHLTSVVGLVWRSVVLWMSLLALITLARLP